MKQYIVHQPSNFGKSCFFYINMSAEYDILYVGCLG